MYFSCQILLVMFLTVTTSGNYTVTITLHSYSNLLETCVECNSQGFYGCCDDSSRRASQGCAGSYFRCDTQFHFCLLPVGSVSSNPPIQCSGPTIDTAIERESGKTIDFPLGEVLQINNPLVLSGISSIWMGVQFQATVWDSDPITYGGSDIIDVISLDINDAVMPGAPPQTIVINGFYDIATLNFSYQVTCDSRFYGDSCQHFNNCPSEDVCGLNGTCIDGQDSYSCQCSPGFSGENCDVQIPKELLHIDSCIGVNCSGNGQCKNGTSSYTCICDLGFTGENCALNIDDCMNNSCSGNGVCFDGVNSFSCECDSGYTGELCDSTVTSGCSSSHCTNGSCRLDENSEPVCSCDPGYTGERCHIDIDDCSGVECGSNYRCMDRVNSYDCICDFGHIGTLCEPSTEGLTTAEGKETTLPLAIGGVMGGVILLLLLLTIVLIILVLVSCQAVRKTAKDKMNDSECTSNHFVGFNAIAQSVEQSEVFNLTANVGYGVLGAPDHKDHPERSSDEEGYENDDQDGFRCHAFDGGRAHQRYAIYPVKL